MFVNRIPPFKMVILFRCLSFSVDLATNHPVGHMSKGKYEFEYIMNTVLWVYLTLLLPRRMLEDEQDDDVSRFFLF